MFCFCFKKSHRTKNENSSKVSHLAAGVWLLPDGLLWPRVVGEGVWHEVTRVTHVIILTTKLHIGVIVHHPLLVLTARVYQVPITWYVKLQGEQILTNKFQ